jgi:hypothetical protein
MLSFSGGASARIPPGPQGKQLQTKEAAKHRSIHGGSTPVHISNNLLQISRITDFLPRFIGGRFRKAD